MTDEKKPERLPHGWVDGGPRNYFDAPLKTAETGEAFHIGQGYDKKPADQMQCQRCNGTVFHLAIGSYFTAVRCVECRWEACVHDG